MLGDIVLVVRGLPSAQLGFSELAQGEDDENDDEDE